MKIFVDGYTIDANPSLIGGGIVIEKNGKISDIKIDKPGLTNNEAELRAVLQAAEDANEGDEILTDSQVVFYWARDGFAKARPDLNSYCQKIKKLMKSKKIRLTKISREENLAGLWAEKQEKDNWIKKFKKPTISRGETKI